MAERLTIQQATVTANRAERRTLDGRTHLVAPLVALVAGVVNGELITPAELALFATAWNGRPVPLRHPQDGDGYISANAPDVISSLVVGQVFGMHVERDRLLGELWLDEEKCRRLGGDALAALERIDRGEVMEVSTAYFCEFEPAQGAFLGKPYNAIQHNLRPDHVALLPDEVGACSVADGCGANRMNRSAGDQTGEGPQPEAVRERAQAPAAVVNCSCSGGTMNEQEKKQADAEAVRANEDAPQPEESAGEAVEVREAALPSELTEFAEAVREFGGVAALMDAVRSIKANSDREKAQIVARLAANSRCAFSQAELEAMPLDHLGKLDASLTPAAASYMGRNGAALAANLAEELRPAKAAKAA